MSDWRDEAATRPYRLEDLAAAAGVELSTLGRRLGISGSVWKDYRDNGVSPLVADRLACRVGFHPGLVWQSWWDDEAEAVSVECADEKCRRPFLPARPNQRYCSRACCQRAAGRASMRRRRANPETAAVIAEGEARYRAETREAKRAYSRRYYEANRERLLVEQRRRDHARRTPNAARAS